MSNALEQLKATGTVVVSDSGDFESIEVYKPRDATTNPSLILAAVQANNPKYNEIIDKAVDKATEEAAGVTLEQKTDIAFDNVLVGFGVAILNILKRTNGNGGYRVSTEVDARLSFDKEATIQKAKELIHLYETHKEHPYNRAHILIKIASTWEGIQAAKELEKGGIHCNMTLIFGFGQAVASAEAGVTLISPFVGRILDWHKKHDPSKNYDGNNDPGVQSVKKIFNYYKQYGYKTIVMGASFRNTGEIKALAGVDYLTIAPKLLEELRTSSDQVPKKLGEDAAKAESKIAEVSFIKEEPKFRWELLQDSMAFDKLHEGIKKFAEDGATLKALLKKKIQEKTANKA